jgi:heme ABC exporter ATP-binding subunit CcmA
VVNKSNENNKSEFRVRIKNLGKHYAQMLLFKNINFELNQGDILAITGWNGSGKSTLLRILAGLVKASAGRVDMFLNDQFIPFELRRLYLGMVAPALSIYLELTARENLEFFARVRGLKLNQRAIEEIIERVGLKHRGDDICGTYSSGMLQRLKFAQALLHKPPLLLLDEPFNNLDRNGIQIVEDIISEQRFSGVTIIASNEKREVDYADRVINLSA